MTLLAALVATSQRVGATPARLTKVRELAALLGSLEADEIGIAALYLAGEMPQGRIGRAGQRAVRAARRVARRQGLRYEALK